VLFPELRSQPERCMSEQREAQSRVQDCKTSEQQKVTALTISMGRGLSISLRLHSGAGFCKSQLTVAFR
jgi:hypothetical protein